VVGGSCRITAPVREPTRPMRRARNTRIKTTATTYAQPAGPLSAAGPPARSAAMRRLVRATVPVRTVSNTRRRAVGYAQITAWRMVTVGHEMGDTP
jgi:hypothetical protein